MQTYRFGFKLSCTGLLLGFILIASGCASSAEKRQRYSNYLESTCSGYGFRPGTTQYSQCLMMVDQQTTAQDQARTQMLLQESQRLLAPVQSPVKTCTQAFGAPPGTMVCR